jgi:hypothetical protein
VPTERRFRVEREMLAGALNWFKRQGLLIKKEFYTPWGVCDVLGLSFSEERVKQRLNLRQRNCIGPPLRVALLHRIPDSESGTSISTKRLAREFSKVIPEYEVQRELEQLIDRRFVCRTRCGCVQKQHGWLPLHERIVALELKLDRVDEALSQAVSHLRFATESYVGFPDEIAHRAFSCDRRREQFRKYGVGLLAVRADQCETLLQSDPRQVRADLVLQMHCAERFWRSYVG